MIKATVLPKKPNLTKNETINSVKLSTKSINRCKEFFSVELVDEAIKSLGLKYKSLDEIDVYNVISYILDSAKEKR